MSQKLVKNIDGIVRTNQPSSVKRRKHLSIQAWLILIGVFLILSVSILVLISRVRSAPTPNLENLNEVKMAISKHYVLPSDEEPALATVTDKSKLNSVLANKTENGDRILIYQKNQQAIIYRPSIDRVVDVTPVQIDAPETGTSP